MPPAPPQQLTSGNDLRIITGGDIELDLDGLGGIDTMDFGTQFQSDFSITKATDGAVLVDLVSGASSLFHARLYNWELLRFGDGSTIDLTTYFGTTTNTPPPTVTVTLVTNAHGTQSGNVSYTLAFSESVTGLDASDFEVTNGQLVSVAGSGANYTVVVAPDANVEGTLELAVEAGAATGQVGGGLSEHKHAPDVLVDTKAPGLVSSTPTDHGTAVAVNGSVVLSFSEAIQKGTGSVVVKDDAGTVVASYDIASSAQLSLSGTSVTVSLTGLTQGSHYTLTLPAGGVKDGQGNSLGSVVSTGFTTGGVKAQIVGTPNNDTLNGTAANNSFDGIGGNDTIDGAGGTDLAIYHGSRASYTITLANTADGVTTVKDNRVFAIATTLVPGSGDGTDSLTHTERLQFSDQSVALDLGATQAAGKAVLMMAVATSVGPTLINLPSLAGIFLNYFDTGASLLDGGKLLVSTGIAAAFAGGSDNARLVKMVYADVYGKAPDADTLASWVAPLNAGTTTQAQFMADMAASLDNQNHVNLTGLAQTGWAYVQ